MLYKWKKITVPLNKVKTKSNKTKDKIKVDQVIVKIGIYIMVGLQVCNLRKKIVLIFKIIINYKYRKKNNKIYKVDLLRITKTRR